MGEPGPNVAKEAVSGVSSEGAGSIVYVDENDEDDGVLVTRGERWARGLERDGTGACGRVKGDEDLELGTGVGARVLGRDIVEGEANGRSM